MIQWFTRPASMLAIECLENSNVLGERLGFGYRQLILEHSLYVQLNCRVHVARDLRARLAGGNAARQIRRIGREIAVRLFNHDEKAVHLSFLLFLLRLLQLSLLEYTVQCTGS